MQKNAADERFAHTTVLLEQISELKDCTCKKP